MSPKGFAGKCAAGTKLPAHGPCPKCGAGPNQECVKARLAEAEELEQLRAALSRMEPRGCPIPGACACPAAGTIDLFGALEKLEAANEKVAAGRSSKVYTAMLDAGQSTDDLIALDKARNQARKTLAAARWATSQFSDDKRYD